jgi:hypothetical protein
MTGWLWHNSLACMGRCSESQVELAGRIKPVRCRVAAQCAGLNGTRLMQGMQLTKCTRVAARCKTQSVDSICVIAGSCNVELMAKSVGFPGYSNRRDPADLRRNVWRNVLG